MMSLGVDRQHQCGRVAADRASSDSGAREIEDRRPLTAAAVTHGAPYESRP